MHIYNMTKSPDLKGFSMLNLNLVQRGFVTFYFRMKLISTESQKLNDKINFLHLYRSTENCALYTFLFNLRTCHAVT